MGRGLPEKAANGVPEVHVLRRLLPSLFQPSRALAAQPQKAGASLHHIQTADALLQAPHRKELLRQIKQMTSVSDSRWQSLYLGMFQRYATLVQELPASEVHHHAGVGGMLDHALEVVFNGLKLRRGYVLPPGGAPEIAGPMAELYTYAVASGGLLHDVGKIACDQHVEVFDGSGKGRRWFPWEGAMQGRGYRVRFVPERQYAIHEPTSLLLSQLIVPVQGLSWLASEREVWASWILAVAGDTEDAGPLGEIIEKADGASVARNLGATSGSPAASTQAKPLHQKMLAALRYLLHENKLPLNRPGAAGWLTQDSLWLVSKVAVDALRAQLLADGQAGIPSQNSRIFDILMEHRVIVPCEDKAIWHCLVDNRQGWAHAFTLLRIDPGRIWAQGRQPAAFAGLVTPQEVTAGGLAMDAGAPAPSPGHEGSQREVSPVVAAQATTAPHMGVPGTDTTPPAVNFSESSGFPAGLEFAVPAVHPPCDEIPGIEESRLLSQSLDTLTASLLAPSQTEADLPPAIGHEPREGLQDSSPNTRRGKRQPKGELPSLAGRAEPQTPRELGVLFHQWVKACVASQALGVNEANAMVHAVAGGAFLVTPGIFQAFARQHESLCAPFVTGSEPTAKNDADQLVAFARGLKSGQPPKAARDQGVWKVVQRGFQQLKLHEKTIGGESVWICQVQGARKSAQLKGFYLRDPSQVFAVSVADNPYLTLVRE